MSVLLAYDAAGNVLGAAEWLVARDEYGNVLGLVDFAAHEAAGGEATDIFTHEGAKGAKVWPEWLGSRVLEFTVELVGPPGQKQIGALVHKTSGHRRERAAIEAAIADRIAAAAGEPADIRDLVGGPNRPLELDAEGKSLPWKPIPGNRLPLMVATVSDAPRPDPIPPSRPIAGEGRFVANSSHPEGAPV